MLTEIIITLLLLNFLVAYLYGSYIGIQEIANDYSESNNSEYNLPTETRQIRREIKIHDDSRKKLRKHIESEYVNSVMRSNEEIQRLSQVERDCTVTQKVNEIAAIAVMLNSGNKVPNEIIQYAVKDALVIQKTAIPEQRVLIDNFLQLVKSNVLDQA
jgi:hypothetical protein